MLPSSKKPGSGVRFLGSVAVRSGKISSSNGCKNVSGPGSSENSGLHDPPKQNSRVIAHPPTSGTKYIAQCSNVFAKASTVQSSSGGESSQDEIISDDDDFLNTINSMDQDATSTPNRRPRPTAKRQLEHGSYSLISNDRSQNQHSVYSSMISEMSSQEKLELRSWGLPDSVLRAYRQMGIETMFPWQAECLCNERVLDGGNLVYSAPTSAGKTLVAEILMLKRVLEKQKKAILIYPFVSLAREKMNTLKKLLRDSRTRVGGFMGSHHPPGGFKAVDIAVCTIEKANSLVNRLLEEKGLEKLGCIVVDELHLLGDPSRGYLLELLLTKIQFMSKKSDDLNVQIIGMSATLPNLSLLAGWLNADLYLTEFRPVPLAEHIKIGNKLYDNSFNLVREIRPEVKINNDPDHLVYLSLETLLDGFSILVFTPTKNWAEKLAETISKEVFVLGAPPPPNSIIPETPQRALLRSKLHQQLDGQRLSEVLEQLKRCPAGLDPSLGKSIRFGVAYHHAGLTFDERDIVENSFKQGILRILIATSTLSSGVNLPARRVIVRSPFSFSNQLLDTLSYRQMIGRAGRKGIDTQGESILLCRETERRKVEELVTAPLKPVASCLIQGNGETLCSSMKRAILEVIVSGVANTPEQVENYASCTLLSASLVESPSQTTMSKENSIQSCVKFLEANEFIRLQTVEGAPVGGGGSQGGLRYVATQLGLACLGSSLSPDEGLTTLRELEKARKCFVLENDLHIIYQVIPVYISAQWPNMDWMNYLTLWESLSPDVKRVGELVGVEERFLVRAMRGTVNPQQPTQARLLSIHNRFYTALALHDLVSEVPLMSVSAKYGASKGMLQGLQQAASTFAGMVTVFCAKLGWHSLELLIGQFQDRLQFGIQRELIDLCRLTSLNGQRARILFNSGVETVAQLANTLPADIENLLANSAPFERGKQAEDETEREANKRKQMRSFFVTGKKGLTEGEAALMIVQEAREILQSDLGIQVNWDDKAVMSPLVNRLNASKTSINVTSHLSYLGRFESGSKIGKNRSKRKLTTSGGLAAVRKRSKKKAAKKNTSDNERGEVAGHQAEAVQNGSYDPVLKSKKTVLNQSLNQSFDTSAQIEELFKIEENQVQAQSETSPTLLGKIVGEKSKRSNLNKPLASPIESNDQINRQIISDYGESCSKKICPYTEFEKSSTALITTPILKHKSPIARSSERKNKRVSWVDQVKELGCSPPKLPKLPEKDVNLIEKLTVNLNENDKNCFDENLVADESNDVFGDTFASMDFADMSLAEVNDPDRLNNVNKSCPKTPSFAACSEELLLEDSEQEDGALCEDQLVDILHNTNNRNYSKNVRNENKIGAAFKLVNDSNSNKDSNTDTLFNFDNDSNLNKDNDRGELTISDSFLEQAITTHLFDEEFDLQQEVDKTDKQTPKKQTEGEKEKKEEKTIRVTSPKKNVESNPNSADANLNDDELGDDSDYLFQTPSILREPASARKRKKTQVERTKESALNSPVSPSPKRSQRLVQRRQLQKMLIKQHSKISPGLVMSSDSENDFNSPVMRRAGPSEIGSSQDEMNIVDVCANRALFDQFVMEWSGKDSFSIALGCSKYSGATNTPPTGNVIGPRSVRRKKKPDTGNDETEFHCSELQVTVSGLAVSWDKMNAFYIALSRNKSLDPDDSIAPPTQDFSISMLERWNVIKAILQRGSKRKRSVYAFDLKQVYKVFYLALGIVLDSEVYLMDPKVGIWMLQPGDGEKNIHNIVMTFTPQLAGLLSTLGSAPGCGSVALNPAGGRTVSPRARAVTEAIITRNVMIKLQSDLESIDMWNTFRGVEMPALVSLAKMELNGFGFSEDECEKQRKIIVARLEELEQEAYRLAGRPFSLTSPEDVCQVLYRELRLPLNGEKSNLGQRAPVISRGARSRLNNPSSNKEVLIKLMKFHNLPKVLLEWRKLNSTMSKVVGPMSRQMVHHPPLNMFRIYSTCQTFTATGRVSMHEPNIQNIPKEFDIDVTPELLEKALGKDERENLSNASILMTSFASLVSDNCLSQNNYSVSLRRAFVPATGCLIIGADYSQLELRIMAHMSEDRQLCHLLTQTGRDVFKSIAATWKRKDIEQISESERNEAKQICYGMLYGIGVKALSEQLCVIEEEASAFLSSFKSAYPGVRKFIENTVEDCRRRGFVVTIGGRRRYLPNINSTDGGHARAAAERQAINSTVQGSAADLVKKAMNDIERRLSEEFPGSKNPIRFRKENDPSQPYCHEGAFLVLQLHDELLYEVVQEDLIRVAQIIRSGMENAVTLKVPTPVRLKIGTSWGEIQDMKEV